MIIQKILPVLALAALVSSCQQIEKDDPSIPQEEDKVVEKVSARYESPSWNLEAVNKTLLVPDTKAIFWHPGDQIRVYNGSVSAVFVSSNESPVQNADFKGKMTVPKGTQNPYWCVYPSDKAVSSDGLSVNLVLPGVQNAVPGTFQRGSFPAVGKAYGPNMAFYNVGGGFRLSIGNGKVSRIVLKSVGGVFLAGQAQVSVDSLGRPCVQSVTSGLDSVVLNAPAEGFRKDSVYYLSSLPANMTSGYTIRFYVPEGSAVRSSSKALIVRRSTFYDLGVCDEGVEWPVAPRSGKADYGWFELPAQTDADRDGIDDVNKDFYYSHTFRADAASIRNFSCCYSGGKHQPVWVAAPMHKCYKGSSGRHDSYKDDPNIKCQQTDKVDGYTRGHMVGSSDRTVSVATNKQAFYHSNIAAQLSSGFNTGGGAWNNLEDLVDGQWCNDTLYQVIGCIFDSFTDKYGNTVSPKQVGSVQIPTAFYKVLLRTKSGNSGKSVDKCSASELKCCAFVLAHRSNQKHAPCASDIYSVADVEKLTGLTFFVNVPNAPKSTVLASDWGL